MSRYICCYIDGQWHDVWKYKLGVQPSEMYRIYEELGIGEYHPVGISYKTITSKFITTDSYEYQESRSGCSHDILILKKEDIPKLNLQLERLKNNDMEKFYCDMIKSICVFMILHPEQKEFIFEGEL